MKAIQLQISGNWAQFRKAETNNNPLSHDLITKTALIGLIGAVLGIDRKRMRELFPVLSADLLYGVQIVDDVNKQSCGFTLRKAGDTWSKSPGQMEFLRNPKYLVLLALNDEKSSQIFDSFIEFCKKGSAYYEPVLGLHNCPAEIKFIDEGTVEFIPDEIFETKSFVTNQHTLEDIVEFTHRIGFDKIPTYQNNDFWNLPEKFVQVIYPSEGNSLKVRGDYYQFNGKTNWVLI